jgi:hypothetical protein
VIVLKGQQMAEKSGLTTKQKKALSAMLTERTTEQAAAKAGISERQLYRWLELPGFQAELKALESQLIDAATRRLLVGIDDALDTLHHLMTFAESEAVKRQAASDWLAKLLQVKELADLEKRIAALEARNL